jgi:hypothetical protein
VEERIFLLGRSLIGSRKAAKGHQQRCERNPTEGGVTELWKTEDEQDARRDG